MNISINKTLNIGGQAIAETTKITTDGCIVQNPSIAAPKVGVMSATAGTLTGPAGHGIVNGQVIDVYWTGGVRTGCTVGVVAGTAIPVTGGNGDALPAAATAIKIAPRTLITVEVADGKLKVLGFGCAARATISIKEAGNTEIYTRTIPAGATEIWYEAAGLMSPVDTYDIIGAYVSHDGTTAQAVNFAVGYSN